MRLPARLRGVPCLVLLGALLAVPASLSDRAVAAAVDAPAHAPGTAPSPLLLRAPAISSKSICFEYGGDLWLVPREGGEARRLTAGPGEETDPAFSPDGAWIAFTGEYEGNRDVYLVAAEGGQPQRLTHHPGEDEVIGWTPDGARILFRSKRLGVAARTWRLFTVDRKGGLPEPIELPEGYDGAWSPDGRSLAWMGPTPAFRIWKHYRGGGATWIAVTRLADASLDPIPREGSNDFNPMWVGETIYFLSDRDGPVTLYGYDTRARQVKKLLPNTGFDLKSARATSDAIVYDHFGALGIYDLLHGQAHEITVRLQADLPQARPHFVPVEDKIRAAALSPSGVRAVFEARGDIFTVPKEKGDIRNLSDSPGTADRDPAVSPDGATVAWLSDDGGEYALHLRDAGGRGAARRVALGDPPAFYYAPLYSPDGKKIAYLDNRLSLWYVDLASGRNVKVATDTFDMPWMGLDPSWSPDSRFLAYTRQLPNRLRAVFVHDLDGDKDLQVSDGRSDASHAVFDLDGKHLYFLASNDAGPSAAWLDLSSFGQHATSAVYVAVLRRDLPSPLAPQSDEEGAKANEKAQEKHGGGKAAKGEGKGQPREESARSEPPASVRIDADGLSQRILALPIAPRRFSGLFVNAAGSLLLVESVREPGEGPGQPVRLHETVHRFTLEERRLTRLVDGLSGFGEDSDEEGFVSTLRLSADGRSILYKRGEDWFISAVGDTPIAAPDGEPLHTDSMSVLSDPPAEWRQMYREAWRMERDFFYDPHHHGLDLVTAETLYAPFLERLGSRQALDALFAEMLGQLSVGHLFVTPPPPDEPLDHPGTGLLGADFDIRDGRYRIRRIYRGENWNPALRAPLTEPGVNVSEGDFLLAVNGHPLNAADEVYALFEGTAGRTVALRVARKADGSGARDVNVVPIADETQLRHFAWVEANRATVDSLSRGRLAYVYLPNTGDEGAERFNREFYSQIDREGAVIDERNNGGGYVADSIIDVLRRSLASRWTTRYGADFSSPAGALYGPKAMIINGYAGSGGDYMPWLFRKMGVGPLVGQRTWGGLVGIYGYPALLDGGAITAPRVAFYDLAGAWEIENRGVAPDLEMALDPALWRQGRDSQLEAAVKSVVDRLASERKAMPPKPPYPDYHHGAVTGGSKPMGR
jgi:tricorn protease